VDSRAQLNYVQKPAISAGVQAAKVGQPFIVPEIVITSADEPIKPTTTKLPPAYTLLDLLKHIKALKSSNKTEKPNEKKQNFINSLWALYNTLKSHPDDDALRFLSHTVCMLNHLKQAQSDYQDVIRLHNNIIDNEKRYTLASGLVTRQLSIIAAYEDICKQTPSFSQNAKIITSVIITAVFAVMGAALFGAIGFILGGGAFSTITTLAGIYKGSVTGATIGSAIGTALFGSPAYAISQHLLFTRPHSLTKVRNAIATTAEEMCQLEHHEEIGRILEIDEEIATTSTPQVLTKS